MFQIKIEKLIQHPRYDPKTIANDIALIRLATVARTMPSVMPLCLPKHEAEIAEELKVPNLHDGLGGLQMTVVGWGQLEGGPGV